MSVEPALAAIITIAQMTQRHEELAAAEPQPGIEGVLLSAELLVLEKWLEHYRQTIAVEIVPEVAQ